jgi:hypothetical protein
MNSSIIESPSAGHDYVPSFNPTTYDAITHQTTKPSKIYICYYDHNEEKNTCKWLLTPDPSFAKLTDQSFELANMNDLNDWAAATGKVFDKGIIEVEEGNCKWVEEKTIDAFGWEDWKCGYEIIWD